MPPGTDDPTQTSPDDGAQADPPAPAPVVVLTPDQIRAHPEFQALLKQNRQLAREKGSVERQFADFRTEAAEAQQAAEAERQAALERQLREQLGEDGVAVYQEIAELSQSDPFAAALRIAELRKAPAGQTPVPAATGTPAAGEPEEDPVAGNANAAASAAPPPPSQGLDGGAPLGQASTGEDVGQIIKDLESHYAATVARNQDMRSRNRVTMRDRASALIGYIGAAYLKAGAKPKSNS